MALVLVALVAAGCGGGSGGGSGKEASGDVDASATLRAMYPSMPDTLDPIKAPSETQLIPFVSPVYDRLTQLKVGDNGQAELAPMVAESWEFSEDGKTLTFLLRDDVTFSDDSKVDAAAVKASLERAVTTQGSTAAPTFAAIDTIETPDATTLVITLKAPTADLPNLLASSYGSIINPKAFEGDELGSKPAGSGGYVVSDYKAGQSVTYERREGYWDPEATKSKKIVITSVPDPITRISAIRSGQTDVVMLTANMVKDAIDVAKDPAFKITKYKAAGSWIVVPINQNRKYMDDPRVRQALNYAVDRKAFSETILAGAVEPTSQILAPTDKGFLKDKADLYAYDPAKAKQLLADAGVPKGYEITMIAGNYSPVKEVAEVLQAQLAEVGITLKIDIVDVTASFAGWTKDSKYDLLGTTTNSFDTPRLTLSNQFLTFRALLNPAPTEFIDALSKANDPGVPEAERDQLVTQANTLATDGAWDIFITGGVAQFLTTAKVVDADKQGRAAISQLMDLRYVGMSK